MDWRLLVGAGCLGGGGLTWRFHYIHKFQFDLKSVFCYSGTLGGPQIYQCSWNSPVWPSWNKVCFFLNYFSKENSYPNSIKWGNCARLWSTAKKTNLFSTFRFERSSLKHQHRWATINKKRSRGNIRRWYIIAGVRLSIPAWYFPFLLLTLDD